MCKLKAKVDSNNSKVDSNDKRVNTSDFDFSLVHSQLIKQYYNKQTSATSNKYPVAFLSVNIPPSFLDVNLEPNKTSVMLTNKEEVMTVLTNLVEEFYSDEKNKLPSSNNIDCNNVAEKGIAIISKLGDITNTCSLDGEVTSCTSSITGKKSNAQNTSLHLNRNSVLEDTRPKINVEREVEQTHDVEEMTSSSTTLFDNNSKGENSPVTYKNGLTTEESSCHEGTIPASRVKDSSSSSVVVKTVTADQGGLRSSLQNDTCRLPPTDSLQSVELCETMSDKTLCETSESTCHLENNLCNSLKESRDSHAMENGNCEIGNSLSNLSNDTQINNDKLNEKSASKTVSNLKNTNVANTNRTPLGNQELSKNTSLACTLAKRSSLENLFSLDMDDLFEDSDFDLSDINSNLKTTGTSNHDRNSEKAPAAESSSSAFDQETASAVKSPVTVVVSSGATEAPCSDKEWSMGRGIVDKQGNPVQVRAVINFIFTCSLDLHIRTKLVTVLCG